MWDIFVTLLAFAGTFILVIGAMPVFFVSRAKRKPMDESNRINHIRLIWWAYTKPEMFATCAGMEWLQRDEGDNINVTKTQN